MRIGEAAQRAGVHIETLRYYERRGLLAEPARSPNGHRAYGEETVRFLRAVKEAQSLGFTLAEIEEHLQLTRRSRSRRGQDPELGALVHVTNGESAGNTLRATGLGGAVISWQDILHEGPVPAVPAPQLRAIRARFLSDCGWGSERALLDSLERRDRLLERALGRGRRLVLWFENDLYDQLQLLQVLSSIASAEHSPEALELIQADHAVGGLAPRGLEALWPQRRPVTPRVLEEAQLGWEAFRAPEPTVLEELAASRSAALPFVGPAMRRLLEELPDVETGLSRTERQLLEALVEGARTPWELFAANQAREEAAFAGDTWVWKRLVELKPLVVRADGGALPPAPPLGDPRAFAAAPLRITDLGRRVLAGEADRVDIVGLDRWLGGTHLERNGFWRWDPAAARVARG